MKIKICHFPQITNFNILIPKPLVFCLILLGDEHQHSFVLTP